MKHAAIDTNSAAQKLATVKPAMSVQTWRSTNAPTMLAITVQITSRVLTDTSRRYPGTINRIVMASVIATEAQKMTVQMISGNHPAIIMTPGNTIAATQSKKPEIRKSRAANIISSLFVLFFIVRT